MAVALPRPEADLQSLDLCLRNRLAFEESGRTRTIDKELAVELHRVVVEIDPWRDALHGADAFVGV